MIRRLFLWLTLLLSITATSLLAQVEIDFTRWESVAERAEATVDEAVADDETFETLRNRIVEFRSQFDMARKANADRIASIRAQLEALGPAPEGDTAETEPPDIAAKRAELNAQLTQLLAPVQRAEAEYRRADALVSEIDRILRSRQASKLLAVTESPLNPVHWVPAWEGLVSAASRLWVGDNVTTLEIRRQTLRQNLPIVIVAGVLGLILIARGRPVAMRLMNWLQIREPRYLPVWRFLLSLLRIVIPLVGLFLLSAAARASGYLGPSGDELASMLPYLGGFILGFRWIADRVLSRDDDEALLALPQSERKWARFWISVLTVMIVIGGILDFILKLNAAEDSVRTVVVFPITVVMSFALFRIGQILRGYSEGSPDTSNPNDPTRTSTFVHVVHGFGLASIAVAVLSPLLQVAGYLNARDALLGPFVLTLAILGLVMALQRFAADVYGAVTGLGAKGRDELIPIFIGMVLTLLSLPLLALCWGVRASDMAEMWTSFTQGFTIGETRISPADFLTFAVIFIIGYVITRLVQGAMRTNVLPKTKLDIGGQHAIVSGLGYVGIFLSAVVAITGAGIDLSSIALVAGALSVGIGFGLQNIVSNFVSGIILLIERPISEGDWIEVGGKMGYVRDISVRSTRIETFDRTDVIVPNADLVSGTVTNYTHGNTVGRVIVPVGVAYGTDTKMVEGILREIAEAHPMALINPRPSVLFVNFGADSLEFEIRCYIRDVNWVMSVKSDLNHAINSRFAEAGIEIPFAQRDLWLRNPEALRRDEE